MQTPKYRSIRDVIRSLTSLLKPPEKLTISDAGAKYIVHNNPGSYCGPDKPEMTPYMVDPQNTLTSHDKSGVIFVGPAQSGKTDGMILKWVAYKIKCDPMDMIVYSPTSSAARDFSIRRIDRLHRNSPKIGTYLSKDRDADNKFDKTYNHGMILTMSYPSVTEMAGRPIPCCAITDYDRIDDDIGGDGNAFDLASKRNTTFGSFGMTLAESSPSREIIDYRWIPSTPHEAPPTTGILSLYNRGDKRRYYWACPHCDEYFEGEFEHLQWDMKGDNLSSAETVRMVCPNCGDDIGFEQRDMMYPTAKWLMDGQEIDKYGVISGTEVRSSIASYWLKGVAARFVTWKKLVESYLIAMDEYASSGSEESLKKFFNTDLAQIYIPKSVEHERVPEQLKSRAEHYCDDDERVVPNDVRFLIACVDVQKNMFVVQIHGIRPGRPNDTVVVDRFDIRKSLRLDDDGDANWLRPAVYPEDWDLLIPNVIEKSYPLVDGSGRHMSIKITACDSGGEDGATANAYDFYRHLRSINLHSRFQLVKGEKNPNNPRIRLSYPDAQNKGKTAAARGDVPVLMLNSNMLKDMLHNRLESIEPGKGMFHFPDFLKDWWYKEMCSEVMIPGKGWKNVNRVRNEAWDLCYYSIAVSLSRMILIDKINWDNPPAWADIWDNNALVFNYEEGGMVVSEVKKEYNFAELANRMG